MIVNERVVSFINSLNPEIDDLFYRIEREAREEEVPIVRTETRELLKVLELIQKPQRILEVGTAVGFSSIYMSQYLPEGGSITTIEKYPPRIEAAKKNFIRTGTTDRITLLEGDAADILKSLTQEYDMIFMDHMMRGLDGIETLHKLKKLEGYVIPPVVVLTANAISGMREMYLNEGFDEYLPKPIKPNELNSLIKKYFGKE